MVTAGVCPPCFRMPVMDPQTYTYDYPRPMVTVDATVFSEEAGVWRVLLVRRGREPFAGCWALPGGFVEMDEALRAAALRELAEETGVTGVPLAQFHTYGDPGRDPRGRSISVVYAGLAEAGGSAPRGGDDAADARWFPVDALPVLAFDHGVIVRHAFAHIRKERPPCR